MKSSIISAIFFCACVQLAQAQVIPTDLLTAKNALLCASPFKLQEAAAAFGDEAWLKQLGCVAAVAGVPAMRIDPHPAPDRTKPWQVRVRPPGVDGVTLWGYFWSFATTDGIEVKDLYRAVPNRK